MVVTVFPALWLVYVVLFIDLGKVIWWRALDKCRGFRAEPNHETLAHAKLRSLRTELFSPGAESEDTRKITSNVVALSKDRMCMYVDWRHQQFLNIVLFCGKPCLQWSPLPPPHLAYISNIEVVSDIHLRKQSRKTTLGHPGKCYESFSFSWVNVERENEIFVINPWLWKLKAMSDWGRTSDLSKGSMMSEVT